MQVICEPCGSQLSLKLRWAGQRDLKEILHLLGGLPKAGTKENINNFLVAKCNGNIIACMGFEIHHNKCAVLRSLKVKKGFRRQRIATMLFTEILQELAKRKISIGVGFTLTTKLANMVRKFGAIKISRKHALDHLDKSQPSELFDDHLSKRCEAWLFTINQ